MFEYARIMRQRLCCSLIVLKIHLIVVKFKPWNLACRTNKRQMLSILLPMGKTTIKNQERYFVKISIAVCNFKIFTKDFEIKNILVNATLFLNIIWNVYRNEWNFCSYKNVYILKTAMFTLKFKRLNKIKKILKMFYAKMFHFGVSKKLHFFYRQKMRKFLIFF